VARHGVGSPRVALALVLQIDIERAIRLDHPNGPERVRPGSNKRSLSRLRIRSAGIQQYEPEADENNSRKRERCFHAAILSAGFSSFKHLSQKFAVIFANLYSLRQVSSLACASFRRKYTPSTEICPLPGL